MNHIKSFDQEGGQCKVLILMNISYRGKIQTLTPVFNQVAAMTVSPSMLLV